MLTFFRRIRQTLLESGHTRKYALYAISEIALVVIGILIALQINNWNQNRLDRLNEKAVIQTIHQEAINNLSYLDLFTNGFIIPKRESLKVLLDDERKFKLLSKEEQIDHFATALASPVFIPQFVLSERILNSDEFDLIQLDSLKQIVLKLHNLIEQTKEAYRPVLNQTHWESFINNDLFSVEVINSLAKIALIDDFEDVTISGAGYNYDQLLKDEKVKSIVSSFLLFTGIVVRHLNEQEDLTQQVIKLIEGHYTLE